MIQKTARLWWVALLVGWSFDFLFWGNFPGVSIVFFVAITIAAGLWLAYREKRAPSRNSLWLLLPILLFAAGTFVRREPFTSFTNYMLVIFLMALLAQTFLGGRWLKYSLSDFVVGFLILLIHAISKPVSVFWMQKPESQTDIVDDNGRPSRWQRTLPILRGLLLAIPILLVFGALLSSADPIFSGYIEDLFDIFDIENLAEYLFRGFMILVLGYLLSGVYAHALLESGDEKLIGLEKPWLPRFLGSTESSIILGSVDALFAVFVIIQFAYFFGGQSNIHLEGYTYAEYARRGFGELVVVSFFSLLLFLGLSTITRREKPTQRKVFSALGVGLMLLVSVILISAFRRLLLYESAYGFTRQRSYAHSFMIWLGLLLMFVVLLEIFGKQRAFALAAIAAALGFVLTLNILNVDGSIVRQNVQRAELGWELDANYLNSLSVDATPALLEAYQDAQISQTDRYEISAILACQKTILAENRADQPWQSFHIAEGRALQLLNAVTIFEGVQLFQTDYEAWWVLVNGEERPCAYDSWGNR
jgi:hypothetical protein